MNIIPYPLTSKLLNFDKYFFFSNLQSHPQQFYPFFEIPKLPGRYITISPEFFKFEKDFS